MDNWRAGFLTEETRPADRADRGEDRSLEVPPRPAGGAEDPNSEEGDAEQRGGDVRGVEEERWIGQRHATSPSTRVLLFLPGSHVITPLMITIRLWAPLPSPPLVDPDALPPHWPSRAHPTIDYQPAGCII